MGPGLELALPAQVKGPARDVPLAFVGLTSTTLKWMAEASSLATSAVLVGMTLGVAHLAWSIGRLPATPHARRRG